MLRARWRGVLLMGICQAVLVLAAVISAGPVAAATLRINGSTTVNPVVSEAAELLRAEKGMTITVDTQGGSSGGISEVANGSVELGMSSKPISSEDRANFPHAHFEVTSIGIDAVALVVSPDVWEGGVRSLSRSQVRAIYEGRISNWNEVGGQDRRIVFFNKEPGRGTWEVFATWLYGSASKAPAVRHREVGGNEEGRTKVASTRGAITQLSFAWAEASGGRVFVLSIREDGVALTPSSETISNASYPMVRPLLLVTNGAPGEEARTLIDFVLSPRGQQLVRKHGYLPVAEIVASR